MAQLPDASKLPHGDRKFREVRQTERNWCIATSLEIALHYLEVEGITQADVMKEFCKFHGKDALLKAPGESHDHLSPDEIFEISKNRNPNSGFGGLVDTLERIVDPAKHGFQVERKDDKQDFHHTLKDAVARGACFLMPCQNPDGSFHVYAVLGYDGDTVVAYDPWEQKFHTATTEQLGANQDWLVLGRLPPPATSSDEPESV